MNERVAHPSPEIPENLPLNNGERILRSTRGSSVPDAFSDSERSTLITLANDRLQYLRYVAMDAKGNPGIEIYLSNELHRHMRSVGWKAIRSAFEADIESLKADAFGERSLDPAKHVAQARRARTVNQVSKELGGLMGVPAAIKGTGTGKFDYEDSAEQLDKQYLHMRELYLRSLNAPEDLRNIIAPCAMYALIRVPTQTEEGVKKYHEWLLMQRVTGTPLSVVRRQDKNSVNWANDVIARMMAPEYFDPKEHAELIATARKYLEKPIVRHELYVPDKTKHIPDLEAGSVKALQEALAAAGLYGMTDFASQNILVSEGKEGRKRYTIIDQKNW